MQGFRLSPWLCQVDPFEGTVRWTNEACIQKLRATDTT